jgi:glycosyltransferase involved in cell wall biosynthesis
MKLLMITRTLAEFASIQGEIAAISKLGVDQTVASPRQWAGRDSELKRVKPDGFELLLTDCWFSGTTSVRLGNHFHFYSSIADVIGRENWDLVHIDEEPFNFATYHALRACRKHDVPAVFTTWQNLNKWYPPPFDLFEKYVFENAAGAVPGSKECLDLLRRRGYHGPAAQIGHGLDPTVFRTKDASALRRKLVPEDSFVVGFIGRIHQEKGLDTLVKALAMLPKSSVLVLVGRGPYRAELESMIRRLQLQERVYWVPWVHSDEVVEYINAFDVLTLPSHTRRNWKEQFGRVLIEAMACETCVVGSDSGEIPNVIGEAGLVFHEGNEKGLADSLQQLMNDPTRCKSLGRRGRQRVLEHFTYAKVAQDRAEFYRRVCSGVGEMNALAV